MRRLAQASLVVALGAYGLRFWNAWLLPPVGTDSLIYHLTIPAYWLQSGFLTPLELPFHDSAAEHSPLLAETINYGLMALGGDDALVWIVQPAFLLATYWLYYLSVRLLGAGRPVAMVLTALLTLFAPFLESARTSNNELVMTCGCAWLLYGVLLERVRAGRGLAHGACGLALTAATKYVGLVYAAVAVAVFAPRFWRSLRDSAGDSRGGRRLGRMAIVAAALLVGTFFYLRNGLTLGNPVYPARVQLARMTIFAGLYDPSPLVSHRWAPAVLAKMLVHSPEDFAIRMPTSLLLWAGFAASLLVPLCGPRRRRRWLGVTAVVVYPTAVLLVYFWKVPFWNEHRLLFPVYYLLWLSVGHAMGHWEKGSGVLFQNREKGAAKKRLPPPFSAAWVVLGLFVMQFGWGLNQRLESFFSALALTKGSRGEFRAAHYETHYPSGAETWNRLDALTAERPAVIAYAGTATIYPLFGPRLKNRVVYVPVGPDDQPQPIEIETGESLYRRLAEARRRHPESAYWLAGLARLRVEYVYLVDNPALGGVQQELAIIEDLPERFELVFQEGNVYLYGVEGSR